MKLQPLSVIIPLIVSSRVFKRFTQTDRDVPETLTSMFLNMWFSSSICAETLEVKLVRPLDWWESLLLQDRQQTRVGAPRQPQDGVRRRELRPGVWRYRLTFCMFGYTCQPLWCHTERLPESLIDRSWFCAPGSARVDLTPPENNPRENRIMVLLRDGSTINLCANSEDESM